jgi:hypothetical protein
MAPHDSHHHSAAAKSHVEVRFLPRLAGQRRLVFPCNTAGHVEIDKLSEHERIDYLFARALRGRDYSFEIVTALDD